ncbi:hypothetical protein [Candidatus Mesenet endosymbiont of Agriotes lineatus]|uniref:hypothetical protein n=1 Tax=Candidatus Mesenet endosymbiont of Agriotes lineatus TaxID=3077948 RepID=UPI0030D4E38C
MSCSVTLKPTREKVNNAQNSKVALKLEEGNTVANFVNYFLYFDNNDELMCYNTLYREAPYFNPTPIGKNAFGVFTNYEGERALFLVGEYHTREGNIIKEGYIVSSNKPSLIKDEIIPEIEEKKSFYIKPGGLEVDGKKEAIMYDLENNEVQNLSHTASFYKGDTGSTICRASMSDSEQCFEDSDFNIVGEKVGDEHTISIKNNDLLGYKDIALSTSQNALTLMNAKIDFCIQFEILKEEKEKLCKELDESSMMISGQHHSCVSELAKANFAIEPVTYDIGTYM